MQVVTVLDIKCIYFVHSPLSHTELRLQLWALTAQRTDIEAFHPHSSLELVKTFRTQPSHGFLKCVVFINMERLAVLAWKKDQLRCHMPVYSASLHITTVKYRPSAVC